MPAWQRRTRRSQPAGLRPVAVDGAAGRSMTNAASRVRRIVSKKRVPVRSVRVPLKLDRNPAKAPRQPQAVRRPPSVSPAALIVRSTAARVAELFDALPAAALRRRTEIVVCASGVPGARAAPRRGSASGTTRWRVSPAIVVAAGDSSPLRDDAADSVQPGATSRRGLTHSARRRSRGSCAADGQPERSDDVESSVTLRMLEDNRSECRIIAGTHRGARIAAPKGLATRPTGDRVREAAFNLIGPVDDAACSTSSPARARWGSRRSRAARRASTFVESDRAACRTISDNLEKLKLTGARVTCGDAVWALRQGVAPYDLSSSTRPTRPGASSSRSSRSTCRGVLAPDGLLVVETGRGPSRSCRFQSAPRGGTVPRGSPSSSTLRMITAICPGSLRPRHDRPRRRDRARRRDLRPRRRRRRRAARGTRRRSSASTSASSS